MRFKDLIYAPWEAESPTYQRNEIDKVQARLQEVTNGLVAKLKTERSSRTQEDIGGNDE